MKNVLGLKSRIILEKNALQRYFEKHPEKLKNFGFKNEKYLNWKQLSYSIFVSFPEKFQLDELLSEIKSDYPSCFNFLLSNLEEKNLENIIKNKTSLIEFKTKNRTIYHLSEKDFEAFWEIFLKDSRLSVLIKQRKRIKNICENKFIKFANSYGFNVEDFSYAIEEIFKIQRSSYQVLNPKSWNVLKALTVIPSKLPKVIYRGFFMDGEEIIDKNKFLEKWRKGNCPKWDLRKPTSWSTSKKLAINFTENQDLIKNKEEGFHILLKLENPKEDEVIADLRNFDLSRFWSQREIILQPKVIRYTVEEIFPYKERSNYLQYRNKNNSFYSDAQSNKKEEVLSDLFQLPYTDFEIDHKINSKILKDFTVEELINNKFFSKSVFWYDSVKQFNKLIKLSLPLFQFLKLWGGVFSGVSSKVFIVKNKNEVIIRDYLDFNSTSFELKNKLSLIDDRFSFFVSNNFKKFKGLVFYVEYEIKLVKNNSNSFLFLVDLKNEFYCKEELSDLNLNKYFPALKEFIKKKKIGIENKNKNLRVTLL